jgi:hypothetical protein
MSPATYQTPARMQESREAMEQETATVVVILDMEV